MSQAEWIYPVFWGVVIAAMLILEISTTALVSLWFVGGAAGALIVALLGYPLWMQAAVFIALSALLFFTCRDWLARHFRPRASEQAFSQLPGAIGTVTVAADENGYGRAMVLGKDWRVMSSQRKALPVNAMIRVDSVRGVTLMVSEVKQRKEGLPALPANQESAGQPHS